MPRDEDLIFQVPLKQPPYRAVTHPEGLGGGSQAAGRDAKVGKGLLRDSIARAADPERRWWELRLSVPRAWLPRKPIIPEREPASGLL